MGRYIQGPAKGKVGHIVENLGGLIVSQNEASKEIDSDDLAVICVVDNGPFEAAGYCFSRQEFEVFTRPGDNRPKTFLVMDKETAEKETS